MNPEFSELIDDNLGMFEVDHHRKRLVTYSKSGCCWHLKTEYKVNPGNKLEKSYELEESERTGGKLIDVIESKKINNKWVEKVKIYSVQEYDNHKFK